MAQIIKKENIVISLREYTDNNGQNKKVYKTIGELCTYQNDDGSVSQFGEMWGPTGSTKFNIYEQTDRNAQQPQQSQQPQQPQQPQQNYQQPPPQGYRNG